MSEPSLENVKILSQYNFVTLSHDLVVDGVTIPSGTNVLLAPQTMAQLATALRLAGEEQTRLWTIPYEENK